MIKQLGADIQNSFKQGSVVTKYILINVIVFLAINVTTSIIEVSVGHDFSLDPMFSIPAQFSEFIKRFWSLFTYMFMHAGFVHLFFNMLLLFYFGRMLLQLKGRISVIYTYLLGGLAGGILFLLIYNLLFAMGHSNMYIKPDSYLIGASGSVTAILFAVAAIIPNQKMNLMFIGPVQIKWVVAVLFVMSTLLDFSANAGGHLAHIGGALFGYSFVKRQWDLKLMKFDPSKIFKRKGKMKVVHNRPMSDTQFNASRANSQAEVDAILDKITRSGYDSLTKAERAILDSHSKK